MKEREKRDPSSSYFRDSASHHYIVFALLVNDLIIITKELSHPFFVCPGRKCVVPEST
jgi:hypothetical protein